MNLLVDARKFLAALTGAAAVAVSAGLLNGTAQRWTVGGLAVATAFVVYLVGNGKITPATAEMVIPGDTAQVVPPA